MRRVIFPFFYRNKNFYKIMGINHLLDVQLNLTPDSLSTWPGRQSFANTILLKLTVATLFRILSTQLQQMFPLTVNNQ